MSSIGARATPQTSNSLAQSQSWKVGGWRKEERRRKSNWRSLWGLHVDLYPSSNFATAKGHEKLRVQNTFNYRGSQQDLGLSLSDSPMDTKELCGIPRKQSQGAPAG